MRAIWPSLCSCTGISRGLATGRNVINFSTGVVALASVCGGRRTMMINGMLTIFERGRDPRMRDFAMGGSMPGP